MTDSYLKQQRVVTHAWSPDYTHVAIALKNNSHVEIFRIGNIEKVATWVKVGVLKDSSMQVNALSWSSDNKILTGSYDRSVFVYRMENEKWEKDLVICESEKAVLNGEWSPNGKKFAVGTGCSHVFIGYFEERNNWWSSAKIGGMRGSVTAVSFHPSGRVVCIGSADYTFRLVTCVVHENKKPMLKYEDADYQGAFSKVEQWGEVLCETSLNGWVNGLAFSPSGLKWAASCHTGQMRQYSIQADDSIKQEDEKSNYFHKSGLPFLRIAYLNEDTLIGVGYDKKPAIFDVADGWKYNQFATNNLMSTGVNVQGGIKARMGAFESKGTMSEVVDKQSHSTAILTVNIMKENMISTSDINGNICVWKI